MKNRRGKEQKNTGRREKTHRGGAEEQDATHEGTISQ